MQGDSKLQSSLTTSSIVTAVSGVSPTCLAGRQQTPVFTDDLVISDYSVWSQSCITDDLVISDYSVWSQSDVPCRETANSSPSLTTSSSLTVQCLESVRCALRGDSKLQSFTDDLVVKMPCRETANSSPPLMTSSSRCLAERQQTPVLH